MLKPGARFKSAVCETQVMVVKSPPGEHDLRCGGVPMIGANDPAPANVQADAAFAGGSLIGKRYVNADESLELLCTRGGAGTLSLGATPLKVKQAKQLPSSD